MHIIGGYCVFPEAGIIVLTSKILKIQNKINGKKMHFCKFLYNFFKYSFCPSMIYLKKNCFRKNGSIIYPIFNFSGIYLEIYLSFTTIKAKSQICCLAHFTCVEHFSCFDDMLFFVCLTNFLGVFFEIFQPIFSEII